MANIKEESHMVMQEVFEKLRSLQDILSRKFEIEAEIHDIPKVLATKTELVNRLKKLYIEKNDRYEATRQRIASLRIRLQEAQEQREQYEQQMDLIKTQREYEALDKEIRDATEKEQQLRRDLQKEEKALEEMANTLEKEEAMIRQQEEELATEQQKVQDESRQKEDLLGDLETEEKRIAPGLDEEILFKFERIIRSKAGLGIVPVRGDVCTGCHMILPAQFVNDVHSGQGILFCPYCSRILFYQEEEEVEPSALIDEDVGGLADLIAGDAEEEDTDEETETDEDEGLLDEEELRMSDDDEEDVDDEEAEAEPEEDAEEESHDHVDDEEDEDVGDDDDEDEDEEEEDEDEASLEDEEDEDEEEEEEESFDD
jgi:hypothetical protein